MGTSISFSMVNGNIPTIKIDAQQMIQNVVNFDYKAVSPLKLYRTRGNSRIIQIMTGIDNPFDGNGWSLSVGDVNNNQSLYNLTSLDQPQTYQGYPGYFYENATDIYIYLIPGTATTGSGFVYLLEA